MNVQFFEVSLVDASHIKSKWQAHFLQVFPTEWDSLPAIHDSDRECFEQQWRGDPKSLTYEQFLEMTGPRV